MTEDKHYDLIHKLRPKKIILPVLLGVGLIVWLLVRDVNIQALREISFTYKSALWLFAGFLVIAARTFGYMARIRGLSDNELTWLQSFRIIILWEFTSAITPSTVGGTAFAVIFLHKEGISTGRSTAIVLATSFLDELYFVILMPLLLIIIGLKPIFTTAASGIGSGLMNNLVFVAIAGYIIILGWVILVGYGLFFKPEAMRNLIINIFRLPVLRRWKESAVNAGNDIVKSSAELKHKPLKFWWDAGFYTFLSWTARYLIVNVILMAFFLVSDHILIFARQLVLWIMMIISPTPGGSGFAEIILGRYLADLIPVDPLHARGVSLAMALIWRMITYYPFLLAGVLIIPGWIQRNFLKPAGKQ